MTIFLLSALCFAYSFVVEIASHHHWSMALANSILRIIYGIVAYGFVEMLQAPTFLAWAGFVVAVLFGPGLYFRRKREAEEA